MNPFVPQLLKQQIVGGVGDGDRVCGKGHLLNGLRGPNEFAAELVLEHQHIVRVQVIMQCPLRLRRQRNVVNDVNVA